jgi:hypothetical protein
MKPEHLGDEIRTEDFFAVMHHIAGELEGIRHVLWILFWLLVAAFILGAYALVRNGG